MLSPVFSSVYLRSTICYSESRVGDGKDRVELVGGGGEYMYIRK